MNFSFIQTYYPYYVQGTLATLIIALFTVILGTLIGLLFAIMKVSKNKFLNFISNIYIEVFRGTPVLLQVMICYAALTKFINFPNVYFLEIDISRFIPGVVALSLNSGAYVAELIRAGIFSIDKGQSEASLSLGMSNSMTMRYIILPQAIKNILPALANEFVVIIKESSVLSVISIAELMFMTSVVQGATFIPLEPLYITAVIYFVMTFTTSRIINYFERRMSKGDRS